MAKATAPKNRCTGECERERKDQGKAHRIDLLKSTLDNFSRYTMAKIATTRNGRDGDDVDNGNKSPARYRDNPMGMPVIPAN